LAADFWVSATGLNVGASLQLLLNGMYPMTYVGSYGLVSSAFMDPAHPGQILALPMGTSFSVVIAAQPAGELCTLSHASGTAQFVNSINATCVPVATAAVANRAQITAPSANVAEPAISAGEFPGAAVAVDREGRVWSFGGLVGDSSYGRGVTNRLSLSDRTAGAWVTASGWDSLNVAGRYGTPGMPAAENTPGARSGARLWVDLQGMVWLFGGQGVDATGAYGALADLWQFNPATREWAWIGGSTQATPVPFPVQ
jgi:hypothetical protein